MHTPPDEGFDLFRRAIVDRDQHAWQQIHARYRLLLIAWARQSSISQIISESYEDIADQALARAWVALGPQHFTRFAGLPSVLAYLRTCVSGVVIDMARAQATRQRTALQLRIGECPTPEEIVIDELTSTQLWRLVRSLVSSPQEDAILTRSIVLGHPPRQIFADLPDLFRSVDDIYAIKRNFICRLQRCRPLQQLAEQIWES